MSGNTGRRFRVRVNAWYMIHTHHNAVFNRSIMMDAWCVLPLYTVEQSSPTAAEASECRVPTSVELIRGTEEVNPRNASVQIHQIRRRKLKKGVLVGYIAV